jgi:hypothetical protein
LARVFPTIAKHIDAYERVLQTQSDQLEFFYLRHRTWDETKLQISDKPAGARDFSGFAE